MKLSEGGKLYLNEYYILDEALNDVNDFLNEILDRVYKTLEMKIKSSESEAFTWNIYQNKSRRGYLELGIQSNKEIEEFGKAKIQIIYKDIRYAEDLSSTSGVKIQTWSPASMNNFISEVKSVSVDLFKKDIYENGFVYLNFDDSDKSAETIVEYILGKYEQVNKVIEVIENKYY